jgi:hypothetical protein
VMLGDAERADRTKAAIFARTLIRVNCTRESDALDLTTRNTGPAGQVAACLGNCRRARNGDRACAANAAKWHKAPRPCGDLRRDTRVGVAGLAANGVVVHVLQ